MRRAPTMYAFDVCRVEGGLVYALERFDLITSTEGASAKECSKTARLSRRSQSYSRSQEARALPSHQLLLRVK